MSLESPNCQVPVGCKTIIIQKNQASAYPVHLLFKYFPCSTLCKWDIKSREEKTRHDKEQAEEQQREQVVTALQIFVFRFSSKEV